jgi:hypothetical protein
MTAKEHAVPKIIIKAVVMRIKFRMTVLRASAMTLRATNKISIQNRERNTMTVLKSMR